MKNTDGYMQEQIKINLQIHSTAIKYPSFRIVLDNQILDECLDYETSTYEKQFNVDISKQQHILKIEHFNKKPQDTLENEDVAIQLQSLHFNNMKCSDVDLHEQSFYVTDWENPPSDIIKNNLYFGFNGHYEYKFTGPTSEHLLKRDKELRKEEFQITNINIVDEVFLDKLESQIEFEDKTLRL
tara:strand:- start:1166 stop:1717 length:552 start_codon:yes stop_codon:yes gene_type:complete